MVNKALSRYFSFVSRLILRQLRTNSSKYLHRKPSSISPFSKFHRHSSLTGSRSPFSRNTALMCNVEGGLLRSSSLFPYFMLVAFEGGSILRALLLLALYPFISLVRSEDIRLKIMVMVCFFGIKKDGFRIGASVIPKFLLEDVGWEGFEVTKKKRFVRKIGVSAMPRVMVESFLKDYLAFDSVVGSELKVFCGYFVGLVDNETQNMPVDHDTHLVIGISSIESSLDQHSMSNCDEIYLTTESERACWKQLPTDKYPKPLIFHDGRLAFRPTPLASLAMFMWLPFGILLALFRVIVGLCMPYNISIPALSFSGLNLRFTSTAQKSSLPQAKGILYVCNHKTLLDPLYMCFILKKNLTAVTYSISRMSEILSPIRTIRLTRELNKDSRLMDQYLSQGDMVVCPEGTTCREPYILRFSPLFTEMSETIVPVAMDCDVSLFYGTTAGGLKCLDPIFFLMNPFPSYTVKFLDQVRGLSYTTSEACDLDAIGRDSRRFDIANQVQTEMGKTLNFECTKLTRKDKYLVLAGNDGTVSAAEKSSK